jgi:hypothetical protein
MMNNFHIDPTCPSAAPYDVSTFPSITSRDTFDLFTYGQQISAIEETATDETVVLSEAPIPSVESVIAAEREVYRTFGDKRFSGIAAYDFLFTRYKPISVEDLTASVSIASACDTEGIPYTYYIPNSATYYDLTNQKITLPVFDARGRQVKFPLRDRNERFLLNSSALTAIDDNREIIFFPLRDVNGVAVKFPFKGATGDIIIVPPANKDKLLSVTEAYSSLDTAYSNAKDLHGYAFAEYIYSLEEQELNKVGFFYNTVELPAQSATAPIFAAALYNIDTDVTELTSLTSLSIETIIRYYPDRSELTYKHYQSLGGKGPFTTITLLTSKDIVSLVRNENIKLASYNILSSPYWSEDTPVAGYFNSTPGSVTHTSILDLSDKTAVNIDDIKELQSQVASLSTQLQNLRTQYLATETAVIYNSGIIDTLAAPVVWSNIWTTTAGFVAPAVPAAR